MRQPASAHKDSGVEWIGTIPTHWDVAHTRYVAKLESGHTPSRKIPEYWEDCNIPWFTLNDVWQLRAGRKYVSETAEMISELGLANSSARLLPEGTVILSRTASIGFAGILARPMATTQDFVNWICGPRLQPEYLYYVFQGMKGELHRVMRGSTHQTIYMPVVQQFSTPVPPIPEQRLIVELLDRETARVDALIEKKRRLLQLLEEKRLAVITHAVTKGLDANAPMKDSGIDWFGKIPAHWNVARVKQIAKLESGHTPSKSVPEYWTDCDIPWVSLNDTKHIAQQDYIFETTHKINALGLANSSARLLPKGTVVFTRDATIGLAAITGSEMAVSQHIIAWVPGERIEALYLLRVFDAMRKYLDRFTFGATIKTIGMDDVKTLYTPVPPRDEQMRISMEIGAKTKALVELKHAVLQILTPCGHSL